MAGKAHWLGAALACAAFFFCGQLFIRNVGPQMDEVQFTGSIFPPFDDTAAIHVGGTRIPLMIDTYAGSLKALLYTPLLRARRANVYALRMPVLAAGTVTLFLYFVFFRMAMGTAAALSGTAIQALDPLFAITSVLDFGIVVVQHLLTAAALPLLILYHRKRRLWMLGAAAFALGLGLWDKATFIWVLIALAAGAAAAFPREVRDHLRWNAMAVAAAGLLLGASPLVYYAATAPREVLDSGRTATPDLGNRVEILRRTLDGGALFHMLISAEPPVQPTAPARWMERAAVRVSEAAGRPTSGLLFWAVVCAAVLIFPAWRSRARRPMVFGAVGLAAGMAATLPFVKAGASQHVILFWPLPQMLVVGALIAIGEWVRRPGAVLGAGAGVLALSGALVMNEYYASILRQGTGRYWSDAVHPLEAALKTFEPGEIVCLDWGILYPLRFLGKGKLPLSLDAYSLDSEGDEGRRNAAVLVGRSRSYYIAYAGRERLTGERLARMRAAADAAGLSEQTIAVVKDRFERPVYRVWRYGRP